MITLSIVIGAFNEELRIGKSLRALLRFLHDQGMSESTEIIVVAARGHDKTAEVSRRELAGYSHGLILEPGVPVGKGRDIRYGVERARGQYIIFMDADLATPLKHILDAYQILKNDDAAVVIGVRDIKHMHSSRSRQMISRLGNVCFLLASGTYIADTQCGFKGFTRAAAKICFSRLTRQGWSFDMELLVIAHEHHLAVAQLPITDWVDVPNGTFHSSISQQAVFARDTAALLVNRLRGVYR